MIKIIFCAFNEAENLGKFLVNLNHELNILGEDFEIIACLDGSNDNSLDVLSDFKVKILPIENKRGLGLAYKRLFLEMIDGCNDGDLIISLDADNTHNPDQIPQMLKHFRANNLDVLIASRFLNLSIMKAFPLHRKFISKTTSLLLQNLFAVKRINGEKLQDYTSGYRVYSAKKLKELFAARKNKFITEPEFTYTCELLLNLARINSHFDEIEISYDYGEKMGKSKLRIMRNLWRLMVLLIKSANHNSSTISGSS